MIKRLLITCLFHLLLVGVCFSVTTLAIAQPLDGGYAVSGSCIKFFEGRPRYVAPSEVAIEKYLPLRDELDIALSRGSRIEDLPDITLNFNAELKRSLRWMSRKLNFRPQEFFHEESPVTQDQLRETKDLIARLRASDRFSLRDIEDAGYQTIRILSYRKPVWEKRNQDLDIRVAPYVVPKSSHFNPRFHSPRVPMLEIPVVSATIKDINLATVEGFTLIALADTVTSWDGWKETVPMNYREHDHVHQDALRASRIWQTPLAQRRALYFTFEKFIETKVESSSDRLSGDLLEMLWADAFYELDWRPSGIKEQMTMTREGLKLYLSTTSPEYRMQLLGRLNNPIHFGGAVGFRKITPPMLDEHMTALTEFAQGR